MMDLIRSISKKEWRWVIIVATVVIILTGLPYFLGWLLAPADMIYDGLHALTPGDIPVYYSYINQAKSNNFFALDLFTTELQPIGTFNVWWNLIGLAANFFKLSPFLAFQLSRILMIPVFFFFAYLFISYFMQDTKKRLTALLFLAFASGVGVYFVGIFDALGWYNTVPYRWPIDLWVPEAISFLALYQTSHFIASITLTLVIFLLLLISFDKNKFSYAVYAGLLSLFYFNFHPYYLPVIFGVPGIYLLWQSFATSKINWRGGWYLILVFIISLPSVLYHTWLIKQGEVIGYRSVQNVTLISWPIFIFLGYGFLWAGFLLGIFFVIKNKSWNNRFTFLLLWLVFNLTLAYSPLPFQSRYLQGLHVVLVIFTAAGLVDLYYYLKTLISPKKFDFWINNPALMMILFLIFFGLSNVYNIGRDLYYFITKPANIKEILYVPKDVVKAISWLDDQPNNKIILAGDMTSKFIPGFSGQLVYFGHPQETLFANAKAMNVVWFFKSDGDNQSKRNFLVKNNIDYVFYSEYEKKLGDYSPENKNYLKLVYVSPRARIYQVIKD
ncbi:MAG: hypothetical protein M1338_00890 [Patescibacteria group bacterium]|nr:hypothetical protein [Patescibacteria group bacterium]